MLTYARRELSCALTSKLNDEVQVHVPETEWSKVIIESRIHLTIYLFVFALTINVDSILPLMFVSLLTLYGAWLGVYLAITQHAGLKQNITDHRLNSRTIHINPALRFVYRNMCFHAEHHIFPMVHYHALPTLLEEMFADTPTPYSSTIEAYKKIIPALWRQCGDP